MCKQEGIKYNPEQKKLNYVSHMEDGKTYCKKCAKELIVIENASRPRDSCEPRELEYMYHLV